MSISERYNLACTARSKLTAEATRPYHDLRLLIGHANLLESLGIELAEDKEELPRWFGPSGRRQAGSSDRPSHIQREDNIVVHSEEHWAIEDAKPSNRHSEYNVNEDVDVLAPNTTRRMPSSPVSVTVTSVDVDEEYTDDAEEDYGDLALTRTSSTHPPELLYGLDEESDDDLTPPLQEILVHLLLSTIRQSLARRLLCRMGGKWNLCPSSA